MPSTRLYDPRSATVIRAELARGRLLAFGITALVCGGLMAALHHELPFLAHWTGACSPDDYAYECQTRVRFDVVAGVITVALFAGFGLLAHRLGPIRPTLTCRNCGTRGWVLDIEPHHGRCPLCGGDRFDYQIWVGGAAAAGPRLEHIIEDDAAGADLVRRFQETRNSATDRYY
jgi:hypothetical protein